MYKKGHAAGQWLVVNLINQCLHSWRLRGDDGKMIILSSGSLSKPVSIEVKVRQIRVED